jgi:hypothetical protein
LAALATGATVLCGRAARCGPLSSGEGARSGERMRPGESPVGSVTESYRDPIREAGREPGSSPCLGPCPCLPTLSCTNTRQGGSSLHFPMPRIPPISGADDTAARLPPSPYDRMVDHVASLAANGWWRQAAFRRHAPVVRERSRGSRDGASTGQGAALPLTSPPPSTCTPGPRNPAVSGRSGVRQTVRHWRPAEAHASPLAQSPALAVSCREADNLGEAEGAYQRKSGRFQRAG